MSNNRWRALVLDQTYAPSCMVEEAHYCNSKFPHRGSVTPCSADAAVRIHVASRDACSADVASEVDQDLRFSRLVTVPILPLTYP